MPQIPLYQFEPRAAPTTGVRAPTTLFEGERQAAARVGEAVAGLGLVAAQYATRVAQAEAYGKLSDLDLSAKEEWKAFQQTITPASDPAKIEEQWTRRLDKVISEKSKELPSRAKPEAEKMTRRFRLETTSQVANTAKTMIVDKAKKSATARLDSAWDEGNAPLAEQIMQEMSANGLIYSEDIPAMREKGLNRVEYQEAFALLNASPAKAIETLQERTDAGRPKNFKGLDESQRYALIQSARGALNSRRIETQTDFAERRFAGQIIGDAELTAAVDTGAVSPAWATNFKKQQFKDLGGEEATPEIGTRFAEVRSAINNYDPRADSGQAKYAELFAAAQLLPSKMATDAIQLLKEKSDPDDALNGDVAKDGLKLINDAYDRGIYGQFERTTVYGGEQKKEVDPIIYAQAVATQARNQDALSAFVRQKPNATREDVAKFVSGLNARNVDERGAQLFITPETRREVAPTGTELDAMLGKYNIKLPPSANAPR